MERAAISSGQTASPRFTPVSYTHLDVYKRQAFVLFISAGEMRKDTLYLKIRQAADFQDLCQVRFRGFKPDAGHEMCIRDRSSTGVCISAVSENNFAVCARWALCCGRRRVPFLK